MRYNLKNKAEEKAANKINMFFAFFLKDWFLLTFDSLTIIELKFSFTIVLLA